MDWPPSLNVNISYGTRRPLSKPGEPTNTFVRENKKKKQQTYLKWQLASFEEMTFSAGIFNGACVHPMYLKSILSKIIESSENCVLVDVSYMLSMPANFTLAPQKSIKCHSHTHIFCAFLISRTQYLWCVVLCTRKITAPYIRMCTCYMLYYVCAQKCRYICANAVLWLNIQRSLLSIQQKYRHRIHN